MLSFFTRRFLSVSPEVSVWMGNTRLLSPSPLSLSLSLPLITSLPLSSPPSSLRPLPLLLPLPGCILRSLCEEEEEDEENSCSVHSSVLQDWCAFVICLLPTCKLLLCSSLSSERCANVIVPLISPAKSTSNTSSTLNLLQGPNYLHAL